MIRGCSCSWKLSLGSGCVCEGKRVQHARRCQPVCVSRALACTQLSGTQHRSHTQHSAQPAVRRFTGSGHVVRSRVAATAGRPRAVQLLTPGFLQPTSETLAPGKGYQQLAAFLVYRKERLFSYGQVPGNYFSFRICRKLPRQSFFPSVRHSSVPTARRRARTATPLLAVTPAL